MTTFITSDIIAAPGSDAIDTVTTPAVTNGDTLHILRGVNVISEDARGIDNILFTDYSVVVAGTLAARNDAMYMRSNLDSVTMDFNFSILKTGLVHSSVGYAITCYNDGDSTTIDGNIDLTNAGTIGAEDQTALFLGQSSAVNVDNSGHVYCNDNDDFFANALRVLSSDTATVFNSGLMETRGFAISDLSHHIEDVAAISFHAPKTYAGSLAEVTNTGVLTGVTASFYGAYETVRLLNSGTMNGLVRTDIASTVEITNTGLINGNIETGDSSLDASADQIVNAATIQGDILARDGDDVLTNRGDVIGDVDLGRGNDAYNGLGGTVTGAIMLGRDNDTALLDDANATVDGGSGDDTVTVYNDLLNVTNVEVIRVRGQGDFAVTDDDSATFIEGNSRSNELTGAGGNDTLKGRLGDDNLSGGDDDDLLIGNAGADELLGDNGQDTVFGGQGDDELFGGFGNDELFGGAGDDTINPGGAQDTMSGGAGADVFLFETATDAGSGSSADRIDGFVRGTDVIDLVALGTTVAAFIGTSAFSGGGNMEVRYTVNGFGNALVRIDEDGNGTEDARIVVSQTALLEASDFLL